MNPIQFYTSVDVTLSEKLLEVMYCLIGLISIYVAFKNLKDKEFVESANEKILELLPTEHKETIPQKVRTRFDKIKPKDKYTLETVNDVEDFINELKSKMLEEINNGREIML